MLVSKVSCKNENTCQRKIETLLAVLLLNNQHNQNIYTKDPETLKYIPTMRRLSPEAPISRCVRSMIPCVKLDTHWSIQMKKKRRNRHMKAIEWCYYYVEDLLHRSQQRSVYRIKKCRCSLLMLFVMACRRRSLSSFVHVSNERACR